MKPIYLSVFFAVLLFCSCGEMPLEPGQAKITVEDTKNAKILTVASKMANIIPEDGQSLIIIDEQDTALYVVAGTDTLGLCDAVYHDASKPWGAGKNVIVVKDNMAHCFTVVANKDGSLGLQQITLPKDGKAAVEKLPNNQCRVKDMHFDDGSTHQFDFSGDVIE